MAWRRNLPQIVSICTSVLSVVLLALLEHLRHSSVCKESAPHSRVSLQGVAWYLCHKDELRTQSTGFLEQSLHALWFAFTSLPVGFIVLALQTLEAVFEILVKKNPTRVMRTIVFLIHILIVIVLAFSHQKTSQTLWSVSQRNISLSLALALAIIICALHVVVFWLLWLRKKSKPVELVATEDTARTLFVRLLVDSEATSPNYVMDETGSSEAEIILESSECSDHKKLDLVESKSEDSIC